MSISAPSWFLLFWCGLTAALASEFMVALFRAIIGPRTRESVGGPRLLSAPKGSMPFAILSGTVLFAPLYGIAFEWLARADLEAGAAVGAVHGIIAGLAVLLAGIRRRAAPRSNSLKPMLGYRARRLVTRVLFGALLGFLYVVPGA